MKRFAQLMLRLWSPQTRISRGVYVREMLGLALVLGACYAGLCALEDSQLVSDETLLWLAQWPVPVLTDLFVLFACVSAVRRLHDIGVSGGWVLGMLITPLNVLMMVLLLLWPGKPGPTGWPRAG